MARRPVKRRPSRLRPAAILLVAVIALALIFARSSIFRQTVPMSGIATSPAITPVADPRPLSTGEADAFIPLVCGGSTPATGQYQYHCVTVPGYPDTGVDGPGIGISLTSIRAAAGTSVQ